MMFGLFSNIYFRKSLNYQRLNYQRSALKLNKLTYDQARMDY